MNRYLKTIELAQSKRDEAVGVIIRSERVADKGVGWMLLSAFLLII